MPLTLTDDGGGKRGKRPSIAAYSFRADTWCPDCIGEVIALGGACADLPTDAASIEESLTKVAEELGIDRFAEGTFASYDFPKVVFRADLEGDEWCGECGEWLTEDGGGGECRVDGCSGDAGEDQDGICDECVTPVSSLEVHARRWFRRTAGNTLHSVRVVVNGVPVGVASDVPGGGSHFLATAGELLRAAGFECGARDDSMAVLDLARAHGVEVLETCEDVPRRRDLLPSWWTDPTVRGVRGVVPA